MKWLWYQGTLVADNLVFLADYCVQLGLAINYHDVSSKFIVIKVPSMETGRQSIHKSVHSDVSTGSRIVVVFSG